MNMTQAQETELFELLHAIVKLHQERKVVLTIHIENLEDLLNEIESGSQVDK